MAVLTIFFVTLVQAQPSQFLFDGNGNLAVQMASTLFPPQIIGQPQNQVVGTNESATFSVVVADPRQLSYQWCLNGTDLNGQTGASLLLENVIGSSEGQYRVALTNPSGSITSAPAMLWIDNDGDGLGDSWETTYFGNLNRNATSDFDGDGLSNLREFLDGSDPTDPNSARYRLLVIREGGVVIKNPDQTSYNKGSTVMLTAVPSPSELFHAWLGDVITRDNPVTLVMTNDKTVYARYTPISFLWTNVASGNWEVATNWSPNLVPGVNDSVLINSNVTVTLSAPADCADVTLGSFAANLTGSGTLKVRGNLFWTAGTMSGSGRTILDTNALLNIQSSVVLNARTLENGGTILWSSGGVFGVINGAVVTNRPGSLFRAEIAGTSFLGGGIAAGRFDNAGTFRKVIGTGTLNLSSGLNFNNSGTVEINADTFICGAGFTNNGVVTLSPGTIHRLTAGGSGNGTFNTPATALVEWTSGTFTLNSGAQLNGTGLYRINGPATVTANANFTVPNLDLISGTLDGTGTVTIGNTMNWLGATMSGSGRTIIPAGATLNLAVPSGVSLNTRTLENAGTVLWTGAGNIGMNFGSTITNRAGALFHVQNAASLSSGAGANRFDNAGTFRKSTNAGMTILSSIFNNFGMVEIQTGTLLCIGFFTNNGAVNLSAGTTNRLAGGGSSRGIFTTPATALVEWTGGTFTLNPGAQLNGMGLYKVNGNSATVVGNGDVTVQNLDLANDTLSGTGILTIANAMNWTAGTMEGSGRTLISPTATLQLGSVSGISLKRTLENGGTAVWTGSGAMILLNGILTNRPGALFDVQNAGRFFAAGGTCRFDNNGTYRKSVSTGTNTVESGMSFNNSGTLDIRSGIIQANGNYISASNTLLNCALDGTVAGTTYGQLRVAGTVTLNGALSVNLLPGFTPATNDVFTVVTAGARSGAFTSFAYPANRVTMSLSNTPTSVVLRVTNVFPVPQPVLLTPEVAGSDVRLIWTATSNFTYRLEFNPVVSPTNWTPLPGDVTTLSNTASKLDPLTSSNRLYRVRVLP